MILLPREKILLAGEFFSLGWGIYVKRRNDFSETVERLLSNASSFYVKPLRHA